MLRTPNVCLLNAKPTFRRMLMHLLNDKGFEVQQVPSPSDIDLLESAPDIVLVDYRCDVPKGNEFCSCIKSSRIGKLTQVIALLESEDADIIEEAFNAGADSYLIKPLSPEKLLVRMIQMISVDSDMLASQGAMDPHTPA